MNRSVLIAAIAVVALNMPGASKIIYHSNFEHPELIASWTAVTTRAQGTAELSSAFMHSGLKSLKSSFPASSGPNDWTSRDGTVAKTLDTTTYLAYVRTYFYIDTLILPVDGVVDLLSVGPATDAPQQTIYVKNKNSKLVLSIKKGAVDGTVAVTQHAWHCLEMKYAGFATANAGHTQIWLDGVSYATATGQTLLSVNLLLAGCSTTEPQARGTMYFDDMVVSDAPIGTLDKGVTLVHPDFFGHLGMKIQASMIGLSPLDRLKITVNGPGTNVTLIDKSTGLRGFEIVPFDMRTLAAGSFTLTAQVYDSTNALKFTSSEQFFKSCTGIPASGIDENNAICKNGTPVFPVTTYGLSRPDMRNWITNKYVNTFFMNGFGDPFTIASFGNYLDSATRIGGLGVFGPGRDDAWPKVPGAGGYQPPLIGIRPYVEAHQNHASLFMWNWMDEAITVNYISPKVVAQWTDTSHALDPQHLVILNEAGYTDRNGGEFRNSEALSYFYPHHVADVLCFDYYPIDNQNRSVLATVDGLALIADRFGSWNYNTIPFLSFVETCDIDQAGNPAPTASQLRMLAWVNVIHGAKGISWFHYFGDTPAANYAAMATFEQQTRELAPVLLGPDTLLPITDNANDTIGRRIDILPKIHNDSLYLFTVRVTEHNDRASASLSATIQVPLSTSSTARVLYENRTVPVVNHTIVDSFGANAVHMYALPIRATAVRRGTKHTMPLQPHQSSARGLALFVKQGAEVFSVSGKLLRTNSSKDALNQYSAGVYIVKPRGSRLSRPLVVSSHR